MATGFTRDAGWEIGVRRTVAAEQAHLWTVLSSQPWLRRWSGLEALTPDRVEGDREVRSLSEGSLVRVRSAGSLVQLRLLPAATGTTVAFHEEHLPDEVAREQRRLHWTELLRELAADLAPAGER